MSTDGDAPATIDQPDALTARLLDEMQSGLRCTSYPIYLEPMMASGERWTIGIAVVSDTEFKVINTVPLQLASDALGRFGDSLHRTATEIVSSAHKWLSAGHHMHEWNPPFRSVSLGDGLPSVSDDIEQAAQNAISTFSSLMAKALNNEYIKEGETKEARWTSDIRRAALARKQHLRDYFNRQVTLTHKSLRFKRRFDFIGGRVAAYFVTINPRTINDRIRVAESSLLHLEHLRDHQQESELMGIENFELYLNINGRVTTVGQNNRLEDEMAALSAIAEERDISVVQHMNAAQVADRLISIEP